MVSRRASSATAECNADNELLNVENKENDCLNSATVPIINNWWHQCGGNDDEKKNEEGDNVEADENCAGCCEDSASKKRVNENVDALFWSRNKEL